MPTPNHASNTNPPAVPAHNLSERILLKVEIDEAKDGLEAMRVQELPLREALAGKIDELAFYAATAAHKIRLYVYRDGQACLDVPFDQVKSAEQKLLQHLENIGHLETEIADMERTYNDAALWEVL
jgi:hypothetical protein